MIFVGNKGEISRKEGIILVSLYVAYLAFVIIRG
jgi:Ca2+/Na+ antiporter